MSNVDFSSTITRMKNYGFIEEKTGIFNKRGMDEKSTLKTLKLLEHCGIIRDIYDISFSYAGLLRSKNDNYNALMVITRNCFAFIYYPNNECNYDEAMIGVYNKRDISHVTTIESREYVAVNDLAVITNKSDNQNHIYGIRAPKDLDMLVTFVSNCVNEMSESVSVRSGLYRVRDFIKEDLNAVYNTIEKEVQKELQKEVQKEPSQSNYSNRSNPQSYEPRSKFDLGERTPWTNFTIMNMSEDQIEPYMNYVLDRIKKDCLQKNISIKVKESDFKMPNIARSMGGVFSLIGKMASNSVRGYTIEDSTTPKEIYYRIHLVPQYENPGTVVNVFCEAIYNVKFGNKKVMGEALFDSVAEIVNQAFNS